MIREETQFFHVYLLYGVPGSSPGKFLKTKNVGEAISGHFAKCLKSQIYLNYAYLQLFQRRKSPFIFFSLKRLKRLCHGKYAAYMDPAYQIVTAFLLKTGSLQVGISNAKLEKGCWSSSHQRILWANHVVFAQKDSIKLERICEHESSSKGVTAAALKKKPIYHHFTNTERAMRARKKQHFMSFSP